MADVTLLTSMWIIAVIQLILEAGIVLYAYRLTRLTGSFRAWTMIILAFILTAASSVFGIFLLLLNPDLIAGLVQSISLPTLIVSYAVSRSEEHTSELQSQFHLVCRLLLEKK